MPARRACRLRPIHLYCGCVSVVGLAVLAYVATHGSVEGVRREPVEFLAFAICVALGELRPVSIRRGEETSSVTVSTTFAFALLLATGRLPAVLVYAAASVVGDLVDRAAWWKVTFNAAHYAIAR